MHIAGLAAKAGVEELAYEAHVRSQAFDSFGGVGRQMFARQEAPPLFVPGTSAACGFLRLAAHIRRRGLLISCEPSPGLSDPRKYFFWLVVSFGVRLEPSLQQCRCAAHLLTWDFTTSWMTPAAAEQQVMLKSQPPEFLEPN